MDYPPDLVTSLLKSKELLHQFCKSTLIDFSKEYMGEDIQNYIPSFVDNLFRVGAWTELFILAKKCLFHHARIKGWVMLFDVQGNLIKVYDNDEIKSRSAGDFGSDRTPEGASAEQTKSD